MIGNGNVAIDVARMLVLDPTELAPTDTADHALDAARRGGHRGGRDARSARAGAGRVHEPRAARARRAGAAPTSTSIPPTSSSTTHSQAWLETEADPTTKRNVELLRDYAAARAERAAATGSSLRFLYSPVEVLGEGEHGPVTGIRVVRNRIEAGDDGRLRAVSTGVEEDDRVRARAAIDRLPRPPVEDIPFDERRGVIRNDGGRVCDEQGRPLRGEYVVGWIKRGPSGVIGTNKKDAADTVAKIVEDAELVPCRTSGDEDSESIAAWMAERAARRGHVGRLAGDRRARARPRRAARPAARQARAAGGAASPRRAAASALAAEAVAFEPVVRQLVVVGGL